MQTENMWIVIVLLVLIVGGSNLVIFGLIRGIRNDEMKWIRDIQQGTNQLVKPDKDTAELRERMQALRKQPKDN